MRWSKGWARSRTKFERNAISKKASNEAQLRGNARSLEIKLTKADLIDLDREFPSPKSRTPLPAL
jgi:hypothetical protein